MKFNFKSNINSKIYLFSGSMGIIIIALIIFVIYPFYSQINTLNEDINSKRVQLAIYEKQRLNLDETRAEYNHIKNDIDKITSVLIDQDDLIPFIDSLDTVASHHNLSQEINLINFDESIENNEVIIEINLQGNWVSTNNYLAELEKLDKYLIIDNPNFIYSNDIVQTNFTMAIYLL
ncbi:MAG: hypothetical protein Q8P20_02855 [bacterium]|nr:hypothetical protein [bacterium]